jgi:putative acetyltransferase
MCWGRISGNILSMREDITVRHSEPEDHDAVHRVYSGPRAMADTLGLPYSSKEPWRERLAEKREGGEFSLVACTGGEVVGHLSLYLYPEPRRRHSGHFGMAVRDDWRGKGVGTKLLEAALDLADNWLGLMRLDLRVFADNDAAIALPEVRIRGRGHPQTVRPKRRRVRRRPRHGSPQAAPRLLRNRPPAPTRRRRTVAVPLTERPTERP